MESKLKSRKFWFAVVGVLIPVLNSELGLHIDTSLILGMLGLLASAIIAFAHVDGKKVQFSVLLQEALQLIQSLKLPITPNAPQTNTPPEIVVEVKSASYDKVLNRIIELNKKVTDTIPVPTPVEDLITEHVATLAAAIQALPVVPAPTSEPASPTTTDNGGI